MGHGADAWVPVHSSHGQGFSSMQAHVDAVSIDPNQALVRPTHFSSRPCGAQIKTP